MGNCTNQRTQKNETLHKDNPQIQQEEKGKVSFEEYDWDDIGQSRNDSGYVQAWKKATSLHLHSSSLEFNPWQNHLK